jgi:flagellin-specific chaperone FliS
MYDTINFRLTKADVRGRCNFIEEVTPYLNSVRHTYCEDGKEYVTGMLDNLTVHVNDFDVTVGYGSLCKYYFGNNYCTLTCNDTKLAINKLSDALHLQFDNATVRRLDVGVTFIVDEPINNYINHLGALGRMKRILQSNSVYYESRKEIVHIYDKNREQQSHRNKVPELYQGKNVMRIEHRYTRALQKSLDVSSITGALLYNPQFYNLLLDNWHDRYSNIEKIGTMVMNFKEFKTARQLTRALASGYINSNDDLNDMLNQITEARMRGDLNSKQASELRSCIKKLCCSDSEIVAPCNTILELDDKVNDIVQQFKVR